MERMVLTDRRQAANSASLHGHLIERTGVAISRSEPVRPSHSANRCGHLIQRTCAAISFSELVRPSHSANRCSKHIHSSPVPWGAR